MKIKDTSHEDQHTFMVISRPVLLIMRNVSDKICREYQNTHFMFNNIFSENRTAYEILWKNIVKRGRPQMTIWRTRIACWITKAYIHTLRTCITWCFSTAEAVPGTRLNVTLYVKGRLWVLQHWCLEAYCTLTRTSSFIHLQRRCTHQAAWETSASEGRNYTWNLASNP